MTPTRPDSLHDLARLSARIGQDPLLIQAAGGNTGQDGGVMWIKASGTLLADALVRDVFVACDLPAIRTAVAAASAIADQPAEFLRWWLGGPAPRSRRPCTRYSRSAWSCMCIA